MSTKAIAVIQARMGSSRLPGKVLMEIEGRPMLELVVERTRRAKVLDEVVVATTTATADDVISDFCRGSGIECVRGSQFDVLDRFHQAAAQLNAATVVRITGDCPLIDPSLIDDAVAILLGKRGKGGPSLGASTGEFDFVANRLPPPWTRTYPIGLDTEVCSRDALERTWREAKSMADREHVMPYMYAGVVLKPGKPGLLEGTSENGFRIGVMRHAEDLGSERWTVDTVEDLEFVRAVFRSTGGGTEFSWLDVLELLKTRPEMRSINAAIRHKTAGEADERAPGTLGR